MKLHCLNTVDSPTTPLIDIATRRPAVQKERDDEQRVSFVFGFLALDPIPGSKEITPRRRAVNTDTDVQ